MVANTLFLNGMFCLFCKELESDSNFLYNGRYKAFAFFVSTYLFTLIFATNHRCVF